MEGQYGEWRFGLEEMLADRLGVWDRADACAQGGGPSSSPSFKRWGVLLPAVSCTPVGKAILPGSWHKDGATFVACPSFKMLGLEPAVCRLFIPSGRWIRLGMCSHGK